MKVMEMIFIRFLYLNSSEIRLFIHPDSDRGFQIDKMVLPLSKVQNVF